MEPYYHSLLVLRKKELDKIKEGVSEVSEEIGGGIEEQVEEHEGKKIKIEFGK